MTPEKQTKLIELKAQYRILSEMEEFWTVPSKHRAYLFIQDRMKRIIKEIESIEQKPKPHVIKLIPKTK